MTKEQLLTRINGLVYEYDLLFEAKDNGSLQATIEHSLTKFNLPTQGNYEMLITIIDKDAQI